MPMNRKHYPPEWELISLWVRVSAGWRCEWCGARQGDLTTRSQRLGLDKRVVLTVAHLGENKHDKSDCSQLAALCQRCHLFEDLEDHLRRAKETRTRKKLALAQRAGQLDLMEAEL